jgi:hypothetical protein
MHNQLSCVCLLPEPSTFLALSTLTLNAAVLPVKILVKLAFLDPEIIWVRCRIFEIRYRIMDPRVAKPKIINLYWFCDALNLTILIILRGIEFIPHSAITQEKRVGLLF